MQIKIYKIIDPTNVTTSNSPNPTPRTKTNLININKIFDREITESIENIH